MTANEIAQIETKIVKAKNLQQQIKDLGKDIESITDTHELRITTAFSGGFYSLSVQNHKKEFGVLLINALQLLQERKEKELEAL